MDVLECIRKRRAIRFFTDDPVPDDILQKILEAGRWAPGAAGFSAFEFVVVKDEQGRKRIRESAFEAWAISSRIGYGWVQVFGSNIPKNYKSVREGWRVAMGGLTERSRPEQMWNPPVFVIVVADQDKRETHVYHTGAFGWQHILASACAIQNMWLAAYSLGVGANWLSFYDPVRIQDYFGIPATLDVVGILMLGYPPEWPEDATGAFYGTKGIYPRRALEDMVHHEKYDIEKRRKFLEIDPFASWLSDEERERRVRQGGGIWPGD